MSKFLNMTSEDFLIEYEKLHQQLINSENQRKMLADEVEKLTSKLDKCNNQLKVTCNIVTELSEELDKQKEGK